MGNSNNLPEAGPVGIGLDGIEFIEIDRYAHTRLGKQPGNRAKRQTDHSREIPANGIDQLAAFSLNRVRTGLAETLPSQGKLHAIVHRTASFERRP